MKKVNTFVAAHALIYRPDGRFLITHRSSANDYKPNEFDLPGGTIEPEEKPEEALKREVLEETNLKIKIERPLYVYSFMSGPKRHQFQIIWQCQSSGGKIKLNPKEHDHYLWVTEQGLKSLPLIAFLKSFFKENKKIKYLRSNR